MTNKFVPESVLERLVVGQRVRYVPDDECNNTADSLSSAGYYGATTHESYTDAENAVGVIVLISQRTVDGHPYHVKMDTHYRFGGEPWGSITVAAHELALVEEED